MTQEPKLQRELEMLLDDVSHGMESEIILIKEQIYQIKSLLSDAIGSLHDSFASINNHSSQQMKLFSSMMSEIVDVSEASGKAHNIFQHVAVAEAVLTQLLDMLMKDSGKSLKVVSGMTETVQQMHQAVSSEKKVSELLAEINRAVNSDNPDMDKIRQLSAAAQKQQVDLLKRQKEVGNTCFKAQVLASKLASRDMKKVYAAKANVEEILAHLNRTNALISECRTQSNNINAELNQQLGSAIRALQFEDIVAQSLGHTDLHLERMDGFVTRVATGIAELHSKGDTTLDEYVAELGRLHEEIMEYRNSLKLEAVNPVSQENMDEGDVELF